MLLYLLMAAMVMVLVYRSGTYPSGSDTMFHVYRGDVVYQSVKTGNWFPLLDPAWYNGAELFHYHAPVSAYVMALCQFLGGGNLFNAYLWFTGLVLLLGAASWLAIGVSRNRIVLGAFLGALWFFLPNNLYTYFWEGNLARALCLVFLPLFVHYLHAGLQAERYKEKKNSLLKLMVVFFFVVLDDWEYASMLLFALLIFLLCYIVLFKNYRRALLVTAAVICAFLWTGIWTVAVAMGNVPAGNAAATGEFFQSLWESLNPVYRLVYGQERIYFGLAAVVLTVAGIVLSKRKSMPGFWTGLLLLLMTTSVAFSLFRRLPGGRYMLMLQFVSIALCFILFSFLLWDSLKKPFIILMGLLLVLDVVPSLKLLYGEATVVPAEKQMDVVAENCLLDKAKEITTQRLTFMDLSATGARGAYVASSHGEKTQTVFGADWHGADTASNVMQLNQAAERGYYVYLFDRCLELGSDTVLIDAEQLQNRYKDLEQVERAAAKIGYRLVEKSSRYSIYHLDRDAGFGVVTTYDAIAIGTATEDFTFLYPAIRTGTSRNINDYSYEELLQYKLVFLDGFTYSDKRAAEELLIRLSEAGVRVVVSADGIPVNDKNGIREFLGVGGYSIQFTNGYPLIITEEDTIDLDLFPGEHADWRTVYLEGLDECWAYLEDKNEELEFYGTVKNDNIVFVGLNLVYHCVLTKDRTAIELLSKAMEPIGTEDIPERVTVPVNISYAKNTVCIETEFNNVNTCIAYHDNFVVKEGRNIWEEHNLTYTDAGVTKIEMHYPYLWQGLAVSVAGIILTVILLRKKNGEIL